MKRLCSVLLVFAMLLSMMPVSAFAAEVPEADILIMDENIAELSDDAVNAAEENSGGITEEKNGETEPEPAREVGFPEYVTILPKGTAYTFSEDEKRIFFPAANQNIFAGDTFVLYIGDFPAAYIAEDVAVEEGGISVRVKKAPEELYANVDIDAELDVEDSIVIVNEKDGVVGSVEEDALVLSTSGSVEGTVSVTLSRFRINQPEKGRPTLSVDYKFQTQGNINWELDRELAKIRFLGIGTFRISLDVKAAASATITQEGTFTFYLDSDASEEGAITETEYSYVSEASGEGELKVALKMAVGVDLFVGEAEVLTATAGVAGKVKNDRVTEGKYEHTHTDVECYFFVSVGVVSCEMGAEIPVFVKRFCDVHCSAPKRDPEYTFEAAAGLGDIFDVNTEALEALLDTLPRMLSGSQTITDDTELDKSCSVEAGCTLTIAEGQTLVVNGDMEQRGNVQIYPNACLIVHGNYLHGAGKLTLGEDSTLIIDGDYTIQNDIRNLLSGGKITIAFSSKEKCDVKDGEEKELSTEGKAYCEVSTVSLRPTSLYIGKGANMTVSGNLNQNGGDIEGGYYTKKCTITVGKEGQTEGGNYRQTGGSLELDGAFDVFIHGNYSLSGGDVYLSFNQNGPGAKFEVSNNYSQSGDSKATFYCNLLVDGDISLSDNAKVTQGVLPMTLGGNISQTGDSAFFAGTVSLRNGHTHTVDFETPENSRLGTIICENPEMDKMDVKNGMQPFYLGSNVEIVGDLRLVDGRYEMRFEGNSLTVHGNLIQDGATLGNVFGGGESVQITVDGDYVIAGGLLWANGGNITIGGDLLLQGYDAATDTVKSSEPSVGGFYACDTTVTVDGSVVVYCNIQEGADGFSFIRATKGVTLTIKGDVIQRNCEISDTWVAPFELRGYCELIFDGENKPQTISFETAPEVSGLVVINHNPTGLIWGDNTEKLRAMLQQDDTVLEPSCDHDYTFLDKKSEASCTEEGYTGDTICEDCGQVIAYGKVIPVIEHEVVIREATAPSCTENGLTEGAYCSVCNEVITEQKVVPATGHKFTDGVCSVCGTRDPDWTEPTEPEETEPNKPEEIDASRLAGSNRFDTAFMVADQMKANLGIEKFDAVIVASGINFADALSGSYLAAVKNAPILLSFTTDAINNQVKDYIRNNLNPGGTVYILGGESAVPASMAKGLDGFEVKRLKGNDRFGTNLEILKEAGVGDKPVLVCTGLSFADSLSASATELPILLVWKNLTEAQKAFLASLNGNELYVIGGESAVSTAMEAQIGEYGVVERVQGNNRFETSIAIAEHFFYKPKTAVVAYAWNFPDGLCGGPLASTMDAPLILTMDKYEARAAEYIQGQGVKAGTVLGGEALISDAGIRTIFDLDAGTKIPQK